MCGLFAVIWTAGRKDRFGVHGCGGAEEAQQEQEVGEEACKEIPCFLSLWGRNQADSPSSRPWS